MADPASRIIVAIDRMTQADALADMGRLGPRLSFLKLRAPKYLGYFEDILAGNKAGAAYLMGRRLTYPDLSLFQIVEGLRYAFPKASAKALKKAPLVVAVHDGVARHKRVAAYLAGERRIPFNTQGIFRHYPELDG